MAALIVPANTSCDIVDGIGNVRAAGVSIHLKASYPGYLEMGEGDSPLWGYTHWAILPWDQDVRDGYDAGAYIGTTDFLWIPDEATGSKFQVRFVERRSRGTALDHKRVYLVRVEVTWPTSNL
jgi:hypothetical protein